MALWRETPGPSASVPAPPGGNPWGTIRPGIPGDAGPRRKKFELAGRQELERFFADHVIDIVENAARYKTFGVEFPGAIALHGPPGCGKTYAVERLIEHLGWRSFHIDAASIGSSFIHETTVKVAAVFDEAANHAPSVIVIDEMDAFLPSRQRLAGTGQHHVEEVAEFLRRIPEANKQRVLVIAMTNRLEAIDPAILRKGRFDHIVEVPMATELEIAQLLTKLLQDLPLHHGVTVAPLAKGLCGRPLSDVAFVVKEGARLAARERRDVIDQAALECGLECVLGS